MLNLSSFPRKQSKGLKVSTSISDYEHIGKDAIVLKKCKNQQSIKNGNNKENITTEFEEVSLSGVKKDSSVKNSSAPKKMRATLFQNDTVCVLSQNSLRKGIHSNGKEKCKQQNEKSEQNENNKLIVTDCQNILDSPTRQEKPTDKIHMKKFKIDPFSPWADKGSHLQSQFMFEDLRNYHSEAEGRHLIKQDVHGTKANKSKEGLKSRVIGSKRKQYKKIEIHSKNVQIPASHNKICCMTQSLKYNEGFDGQNGEGDNGVELDWMNVNDLNLITKFKTEGQGREDAKEDDSLDAKVFLKSDNKYGAPFQKLSLISQQQSIHQKCNNTTQHFLKNLSLSSSKDSKSCIGNYSNALETDNNNIVTMSVPHSLINSNNNKLAADGQNIESSSSQVSRAKVITGSSVAASDKKDDVKKQCVKTQKLKTEPISGGDEVFDEDCARKYLNIKSNSFALKNIKQRLRDMPKKSHHVEQNGSHTKKAADNSSFIAIDDPFSYQTPQSQKLSKLLTNKDIINTDLIEFVNNYSQKRKSSTIKTQEIYQSRHKAHNHGGSHSRNREKYKAAKAKTSLLIYDCENVQNLDENDNDDCVYGKKKRKSFSNDCYGHGVLKKDAKTKIITIRGQMQKEQKRQLLLQKPQKCKVSTHTYNHKTPSTYNHSNKFLRKRSISHMNNHYSQPTKVMSSCYYSSSTSAVNHNDRDDRSRDKSTKGESIELKQFLLSQKQNPDNSSNNNTNMVFVTAYNDSAMGDMKKKTKIIVGSCNGVMSELGENGNKKKNKRGPTESPQYDWGKKKKENAGTKEICKRRDIIDRNKNRMCLIELGGDIKVNSNKEPILITNNSNQMTKVLYRKYLEVVNGEGNKNKKKK